LTVSSAVQILFLMSHVELSQVFEMDRF